MVLEVCNGHVLEVCNGHVLEVCNGHVLEVVMGMYWIGGGGGGEHLLNPFFHIYMLPHHPVQM